MNRLSKTILDEHRSKAAEVNYRDIVLRVKEMRIPFSAPDISDLAAGYLHEKGIKIWR